MKKGFYFLLIMMLGYVAISCSSTKSYADMLKDQKKWIDRLITDSGFVILKSFPDDTIFKQNEFVKLDDGTYISVLSRGDLDDQPVVYSSIILCRFDCFLIEDTLTQYWDLIGPNSNGYHPVEFRYGDYSPIYEYDPNEMISPGLAAGLPYVGNGGIVRIIAPFTQMGTNGTFQSYGIPVFFSKVKYTIKK